MIIKITNLISQKTLLGVFFCAVLFLTPLTNIGAQGFEEASGGGSAETSPGSFSAIAGETNTPAPSRSILGGSNGNSAGSFNSGAGVTSAPAPTVTSAPQVNATKPSGDAPKGKEGANQDPISFVGQLLGTIILAIPSALVWVAGYLLDNSLNKFVFGMGNFVNSDGFSTAINSSWILIRDICNLAFIFGFVYVGIRTIIDPESASTKRFLSKIIVGALLINFSLFFVKFIVDFANFTAYHIYISMVGQGGSLSGAIANKLGIITFFTGTQSASTFSNITSGGVIWFFVLAAILLFIVAFVFFAASLLLITRFVGIVLIMVASPILFAATVFPQTEHYASDMWKKLISYAFFAPVFLLLLLISLTLITGLNIAPPGDGFSKALMNEKSPITETGAMGQMTIVLNFVVIIFFFIQSLLIAQKMGVAGGDAAVSMGKSMGNKIRGNVQSAVGRNTIGRIGDVTSKGIQNMRENPNSRTARLTGGFLHATVGGVADSAKGAKFGGSMSRSDAKKDNEALDTARAKNAQVGKINTAIESGHNAPDGSQEKINMERSVANASSEQLQELLKKHKKGALHEAIISSMSSSQFDSLMKAKPEDLDDGQKEAIRSKRQELIQNNQAANPGQLGKTSADNLESLGATYLSTETNAVQLNSSQMDDIKKKFTPTEFGNIKKAREDALNKVAQGTPVGSVSRADLINLKPGEIAKLPAKALEHLAEELPVTALDKIVRDGTLSKQDQAVIRQKIESSPNTTQQLMDSIDWFTHSPIGKSFGK